MIFLLKSTTLKKIEKDAEKPCNKSGSPLSFRPHRDQRPVRLSVRTPGFHPGKKGSTPLRVAIRFLGNAGISQ